MADLDIEKIPLIMRKNNWVNGANLMERWFSLPANSSPLQGSPSTDIVTMKWVKSFTRSKTVYNKLISEKVWLNDAAKQEIKKLLLKKGLLSNVKMKFGYPKNSPHISDRNSIQYRKVGGYWDMATGDMDDLRASLGNFVFKIIVLGEVTPILKSNKTPTGEYQVKIDEIGVYIKDSYDFNDLPDKDQSLGNWDIDDHSVGRTFFNGGDSIFNSDFRKWRKKHAKGGDFYVFSDIEYIKQNDNNTFTIKK